VTPRTQVHSDFRYIHPEQKEQNHTISLMGWVDTHFRWQEVVKKESSFVLSSCHSSVIVAYQASSFSKLFSAHVR